MSSKSSPFASFSDVADPTKTESNNQYYSTSGQLTVVELMRILHTIIQKNPSAKDALVFHIEFGALTPSNVVEETKDGVVIW